MTKFGLHKKSLARNMITILFLIAYAFTVTTLDFHHNHPCCHEDSQGPVLVEPSDQHDPCPVLVLTQAHAPVVSLVFDPVISSVYAFDPYLDQIIYVSSTPNASRGPPDIS